MGKMLEAFAPNLTSETVQSFIRSDQNLQKFNAFFKGDGAGRMFVFYQPLMGEGEVSTIVVGLVLWFLGKLFH